MEILNSEGVWFWTEEINGIKIGQICVGRLTLRGWLHGATKEGGQS
jgi:hypothetical protein